MASKSLLQQQGFKPRPEINTLDILSGVLLMQRQRIKTGRQRLARSPLTRSPHTLGLTLTTSA
jgi:hypothetical protein